ncbi:MAG: cobalamin biosynthesis protein CobD [Parasporobacterium sp.]|nr:cobalamin biosynthesis protein CobD [Parasporobacterium sp.]
MVFTGIVQLFGIRILILIAASLLDLLVGDPFGMIHPVVGIGKLISFTEKTLRRVIPMREEKDADQKNKRKAGIILVVVVCVVTTGLSILIMWLAGLVGWVLQAIVAFIMCWQMLAGKSLAKAADGVYRALRTGTIDDARYAVSMIVGRDTQSLDETGVIKATVETVAENTSDGVIAPMMFFLILGIPGMYFYKAVNTMDSMVGYKNDKYRYFGTAAAKLDDVLNFVPARVSGVCMVLAAFVCRFDGVGAWRIFLRDRKKHASPNSAQTESACAGALNIQLAGNAIYFGELHKKPFIGDPIRPIEAADIKRAVKLMYFSSGILIIGGIICEAVMAVIFTVTRSLTISQST